MSKVYVVREWWEDQAGSYGRNFHGIFSSHELAMETIDDLIEDDEWNTGEDDLENRKVEYTGEGATITNGWYAERSFKIKEYEVDTKVDEGSTDFVG